MYKGVKIIAEVKPISPSEKMPPKPELMSEWLRLLELALEIGDMVSIHTGDKWGGSLMNVQMARSMINRMPGNKIPILAKGLHYDDLEIDAAIRAGANYALAVGFIPKNLEASIIEPWNIGQLMEFAPLLPPTAKILWNSRDLEALVNRGEKADKKETFQDATAVWKYWLCQASNIRTVDDIELGANAVLVGTHLEEFAESLRRA